MAISIENLARIVSKHNESKENQETINSLEHRIDEVEDVLRDMRKDVHDLQSSREVIEALIDDLMEEMTVDERLNFKRLAEIE